MAEIPQALIQEFLRLVSKTDSVTSNYTFIWDLVVTLNENHWIIHLFDIIKILNKSKIFKYHPIVNFINNFDLRKLDFLSEEKTTIHQKYALQLFSIRPKKLGFWVKDFPL